MQEMICIQSFEYPPGTAHSPGDTLSVEDNHAILFKLAGKADPVGTRPDGDRAETLHVKRAYTKRAVN